MLAHSLVKRAMGLLMTTSGKEAFGFVCLLGVSFSNSTVLFNSVQRHLSSSDSEDHFDPIIAAEMGVDWACSEIG